MASASSTSRRAEDTAHSFFQSGSGHVSVSRGGLRNTRSFWTVSVLPCASESRSRSICLKVWNGRLPSSMVQPVLRREARVSHEAQASARVPPSPRP